MRPPDRSITFDRAVRYYDQSRGFPEGTDREAAALMARLAGLTRRAHVLEIGIGTGRIGLPLAAHSATYTGIDLSAGMLDTLRSKRPHYPDSDLRLICADVMRLPLAPACMDFAVLVHILHLLPDARAAVAELSRVVRPDGAAIAGWNRQSAPTFGALDEAWNAATGSDDLRFDAPDAAPTLLAEGGWSPVAQDKLSYTSYMTPRQRADTYRQRIFSSMWRLQDTVWQAGVAAVETALTQHYPAPDTPHEITHTFYVAVYRHP